MSYRLCEECGQPTKAGRHKPGEYDHAQGCPTRRRRLFGRSRTWFSRTAPSPNNQNRISGRKRRPNVARKKPFMSPANGRDTLRDGRNLCSTTAIKIANLHTVSRLNCCVFLVRFVGKQKLRSVESFTASNEAEALEAMREFASRPDVTLVEEKSRKAVPKEWMEESHEVK